MFAHDLCHSVTVHRFRVKDKEGIKDLKFSLKMLIFPNNCQFGSKFFIAAGPEAWLRKNLTDWVEIRPQ
jgi:hypothetical protein